MAYPGLVLDDRRIIGIPVSGGLPTDDRVPVFDIVSHTWKYKDYKSIPIQDGTPLSNQLLVWNEQTNQWEFSYHRRLAGFPIIDNAPNNNQLLVFNEQTNQWEFVSKRQLAGKPIIAGDPANDQICVYHGQTDEWKFEAKPSGGGSGMSDIQFINEKVKANSWIQLSKNLGNNLEYVVPNGKTFYLYKAKAIFETNLAAGVFNTNVVCSLSVDGVVKDKIKLGGAGQIGGSTNADNANSNTSAYSDNEFLVDGMFLVASKIKSGNLSDSTIVNPTFTPDEIGNYTLQLEVSDGKLTDKDIVNIEIKELDKDSND